MKRPSIFFAIPCGEYYDQQAQIIRQVCDSAAIDPIIIEHGLKTADLWKTIIDKIEQADYFVADISSLRPNIILELGYAFKAKHESKIVFLISKNVDTPADLIGKKRLEYAGFTGFQRVLIDWLRQVVGVDKESFKNLSGPVAYFHDEFQDFDRFLRLWSTPPGCDFTLAKEGLKFTNAHMPILSRTLGLLINFEFTFTARIQKGNIGWVIKGTKDYRGYYPPFCVMFNTNLTQLTPHILDLNNPHPQSLYWPFAPIPVSVQTTTQGWFTVVTRCVNDTITVLNENKVIFEADFAKDAQYAQIYNSFNPKQGQIGFRCHPGEEALIRSVEVREI